MSAELFGRTAKQDIQKIKTIQLSFLKLSLSMEKRRVDNLSAYGRLTSTVWRNWKGGMRGG